MFSWPNTSWYQLSSRSRTFEITTATEHRAERAVTRSGLFFTFCAKIPNSTHRRNLCQSSRRTPRKNRQSPIRCVVPMTLVQIAIQFCFTDSETTLEDKVRFINSINSSANIFACGLMKSRNAFGTAFELQRPRRPSKNSWRSPSSSKDLNVHHNAR